MGFIDFVSFTGNAQLSHNRPNSNHNESQYVQNCLEDEMNEHRKVIVISDTLQPNNI